eukprot:NODE_2424_length_1121_cov_4.809701_g2014_i0.p1 GENE.NODE_2424_length_1121_cov_4.809701_g2014_i0~~NODE_2424_length_1121_cov_4.809701_g2014_i0.p1  ORF type:complete len:355 (-),score=41.50 NODE_2424_length_1121_cov_4.809701_g2014_i0:55-1032(-)
MQGGSGGGRGPLPMSGSGGPPPAPPGQFVASGGMGGHGMPSNHMGGPPGGPLGPLAGMQGMAGIGRNSASPQPPQPQPGSSAASEVSEMPLYGAAVGFDQLSQSASYPSSPLERQAPAGIPGLSPADLAAAAAASAAAAAGVPPPNTTTTTIQQDSGDTLTVIRPSRSLDQLEDAPHRLSEGGPMSAGPSPTGPGLAGAFGVFSGAPLVSSSPTIQHQRFPAPNIGPGGSPTAGGPMLGSEGPLISSLPGVRSGNLGPSSSPTAATFPNFQSTSASEDASLGRMLEAVGRETGSQRDKPDSRGSAVDVENIHLITDVLKRGGYMD